MTSVEQTPARVFDLLGKSGGAVITGTVVCFAVGFAITNTFLGSLGIAVFDILRARYVLSGLLFLFFIGSIAYLLAGVVRILRARKADERLKTTLKIVWFSMLNLTVLSIVVLAISVFGGVQGARIAEPPGKVSIIDWGVWIQTEPLRVASSTGSLVGLILAAVAIIVILLLVINPNPKEGPRKSRRDTLRELGAALRREGLKSFQPLLGIVAFMYLLNLLASAMGYWATGVVQVSKTYTLSLHGGWAEYFFAIALIYTFAATYVTLVALFPPGIDYVGSAMPFSAFTSYAYLAALAVAIAIPVYALKIYPLLPQQVGGGLPIRVRVSIVESPGSQRFQVDNTSVFLIDRTSSTYIFLVRDSVDESDTLIEIKNELVESVEYIVQP